MYVVISRKYTGEVILPDDTNQLMDNLEAVVNGTKIFNHFATSDTTVVVNLNADMLDNAHKSIDNTFSSESDDLIPTEKAIKEYIDNTLAIDDVVFYKGQIDCSTNPEYPAANAGWVYIVSSTGKIGGPLGEDVDKDAFLICKVDDSPSGDYVAVGTNWTSVKVNTGDLTTSTGLTVVGGTAAIIGSGTRIGITTGYYLPIDSDHSNWDTAYTAIATAGNFTTSTGLSVTGGIASILGLGVRIGISTGYYLPTNTDHTNWDSAYTAITTAGNFTTSTGLSVTGGTSAVLGSGVLLRIASGYYLPTSTDHINWNFAYNAINTTGNFTTSTGLTVTGGTGAVIGSGTKVVVASGYYLPTTSDQSNWNGKQNLLVNSAGLASALNDETGTGVAVFNTAPSLTDPTISKIYLDTNPTIGSYAEGKMYYDNTWKAATIDVDGDVLLRLGQTELIRVYNNTGSTIYRGKVVYNNGVYSGGSNAVMTVALAQAVSHIAASVIGIATQDILTGNYGFITLRGNIDSIDTSTGGWAIGDQLYLSATTAGGLTTAIPTPPNLKIRVANVIIRDATNGRINVNLLHLYGLEDLENVTITNPAVDQRLRYNGAGWVNADPEQVSAGNGVEFFPSDADIIAKTTNNAFPIETLSKTPVAASEVVDSINCVNNTVLGMAYLYDYPLTTTTITGGTWILNYYASVSSIAGGRVSTLTKQIYKVTPYTSITISITGSPGSTTRTVTASGGAPFSISLIDASVTNTTASFLQTPKGLYQIDTRTNNAEITIIVPSTYSATSESGIAFSVWKKLFGATTAPITSTSTGYSLYSTTLVLPSYTVNTTDKLGKIMFGTSNDTTTINYAYQGTTHYSHISTPFAVSHNDIAGLQGGTSGQFYHLTSTGYAVATQPASSSLNGYLSSGDWIIFNNKQNALTIGNLTTSTGLITTGGTASIIGSGAKIGIASGYYLGTTTDQTHWNAAYTAITTAGNLTTSTGLSVTGGTGAVIGSGSRIGVASGYYIPTTSDQSIWNAKQAALSFGNLTTSTGLSITGGTGAIIGSGSRVGIRTGYYLPTDADKTKWDSGSSIVTSTGNNIIIGDRALYANTTGDYNVAIGRCAIYSNTSGCYNSSIGVQSLYSNTCGYNNIGISYQSLYSNISGHDNIGIGYQSLYTTNTGYNNIGIGCKSLYSNTTGNFNIAMGWRSLSTNCTGYSNVAIGPQSLYCNTTGNDNIGIGQYAVYFNTTGFSNIGLGVQSLYFNTCGYNNIGIGICALYSNTTGFSNIGIGADSIRSNTIGCYNVGIGDCNLYQNSCGCNNVAIGYKNITSNTTGNDNIGIGQYAVYFNTTGSCNIGIGYQAIWCNNAGGCYNIGLGIQTLYSNTSGNSNIALGQCALYANACVGSCCGSCNIGIGYLSLCCNTTGCYNIGIGTQSIQNNTTGNNNISIGSFSLQNSTTGCYNVALGLYSLQNNQIGNYNTALGYQALNGSTNTGSENTAIGCGTLFSNTSGNNNVGIGSGNLYTNSTGCYNVGIGLWTLYNNTTGSNNTSFGRYSLCCNTTGNDNIAIGCCSLRCNTCSGGFCGSCNIGMGSQSLYCNTTGCHNVAIGICTLCCNTTGSTNIALGQGAIYGNTNTGSSNIGIGYYSLCSNVSGAYNIGIGNCTQCCNTTGCYNVAIGYRSHVCNTEGCDNIALGQCALYSNTCSGGCCGSCNVGIGYLSLKCNTTGCYNVGLGTQSLLCNTTGSSNIGIGGSSLQLNTTGSCNVAIGASILRYNTTGCYNVGIGNSALYCNTCVGSCCGQYNNSIGYLSLYNNTIGCYNVALGYQSLFSNTTGCNNIGIGVNAVYGNTITGGDNIGIGNATLQCLTSGTYNVAIGSNSLCKNAGGYFNVAVGPNTLCTNTSGASNVSIGSTVLPSNTTGSYNVGIGSGSLSQNTCGNYNIGIGSNALASNVEGCSNIAIGCGTLSIISTCASYNIAIGSGAMNYSTTAACNVGIGSNVFNSAGSGSCNVGIGICNFWSNSSGNENIAIGLFAFYGSSISGSCNVAIGSSALKCSTTGSNNIGIGLNALTANTEGFGNVAIGRCALYSNTCSGGLCGTYNAAIAGYALYCNTTGSNNIGIGCKALCNNTTGSCNIGIGFCAGSGLTTCSNSIVIGSIAGANASNTTWIANIYNNAVGGSCQAVWVDSTGKLGYCSSSLRYKENIQECYFDTSYLYCLKPYSFIKKNDETRMTQLGYIAEYVNDYIPQAVSCQKKCMVIEGETSEEMIPDSIQLEKLVIPIVEEMKKLKKELDDLKSKLI